MNLRNWTKDHTLGVVLGLVFPVLFIPLVVFVLGLVQDYDFSELWKRFINLYQVRIQVLTISILANLGVFYFFLNRERYNLAMGIILGSILYAPYVIYLKFF